jgi:hypothetical protein
MHDLASSFVLGYHGCDRPVGESLLRNEPFQQSENDYDWLGHGIYFWEANPDRARQWALEQGVRGKIGDPYVVGAVIDLGFCLDLATSNGIHVVEGGYRGLCEKLAEAGLPLPSNSGGKDRVFRRLDCAVINYLHLMRRKDHARPFDSVRGLFPEGRELYDNSGFQNKTHIQICMRTQENIHGVFRVHERYFSTR